MDVLLIEDHTVFRQALAFLLAREPDVRVVGQAGSLVQARQILTDLPGLDVALIDLGLPDGEGAELIASLRATWPKCVTLVLTASADWRDRARAIAAGAAGVLHKSASLQEIMDDLRRLVAGDTLLTPRELVDLLHRVDQEGTRKRDQQAALDRLTLREREVLQALADGLSDKDIAARLYLSTETVHKHMGNILGKFGVGSRLQALLYGVRNGLVSIH
jgi:DNA-binding NarL/FixJ family response regulator